MPAKRFWDKLQLFNSSLFKKSNNFDIFISYRRKDVKFARNIDSKLETLGYLHRFFDFDAIKDGVFDEKIVNAIKNCKDFILILGEGALDRCSEKGDWVSREIKIAIESKCHIVPVANKAEWLWPNDLPQELNCIKNIQISVVHDDSSFVSDVDCLAKRLKSVPSSKISKTTVKRSNNKFIDFCQDQINEGCMEFQYIVRDVTFNISVQSITNFVLEYCKCNNNAEELVKCLNTIKQLDERVIGNSLAKVNLIPTIEILGKPRFMLCVQDLYAIKVCCSDSFSEKTATITKEFYNATQKFAIKKDTLINIMQKLIDDPLLPTGLSYIAEETEKYISQYREILERAFDVGMYRIHFKGNDKFRCNSGKVYYIGYSDMYSGEYTIREGTFNNHDDDNDRVVARYSSAEELLKDGWRLD